MKIKFYNLGTIKETELDLRPLTVIIGPNNSNKTYIAYSVYGLMQQANIAIDRVSSLPFQQRGDNAVMEVNEHFFELVTAICKKGCTQFRNDLGVFYQDSSRKLFSDTSFELSMQTDEVRQHLNSFDGKHLTDFHGANYLTSYKDNDLTFQVINPDGENSGAVDLFGLQFSFHFEFLETIFSRPVVLPAERNAFILTYKMLLNKRFSLLRDRDRELFGKRENQQLQMRLLQEQGDIRYPQPIEDFLEMLSDIELSHGKVVVPKSTSSNGRNGTGAKDNFADVARQIERYIQERQPDGFSAYDVGRQ